MIWQHGLHQERDAPYIALRVIDAYGEKRFITRNDLGRSVKGFVFRTFNVHLDHRYRAGKGNLIKGVTLNINAVTRANSGTSAAIPAKSDNRSGATNGTVQGVNPARHLSGKAGDILA